MYLFMTDVKTETRERRFFDKVTKRWRTEILIYVVYGVVLVNPDESYITYDNPSLPKHMQLNNAYKLANRLALKIDKDVWIVEVVEGEGVVVGKVEVEELKALPVVRVPIPAKIEEFPKMVVE